MTDIRPQQFSQEQQLAAAAQAREHEDAQPVPDDITGDTAPRTKGAPRQFPTRKPGQ